MKIAIISFTKAGANLSLLLKKYFIEEGNESWLYAKSAYIESENILILKESLRDWTKRMFSVADALIFIGACAIAVRSVAPFLESKKEDPAVLVLDEQGKFCISLLSGHLGGANELCKRVSGWVDAIPVITTATDINKKFAVDLFAKKNHLHISDMTYAKHISARLLAGESVGYILEKGIFLSEREKKLLKEAGMQEYREGEKMCGQMGIYIGIYRKKSPFLHTLYLTPRLVSVGIGCRKNTPQSQIEGFIEQTILGLGLSFHSICDLASIDLKKEEAGLLSYCKKYNLPISFYSRQELKRVEGDFSPSEFVLSVTGVDNVCERSAKKSSGGGDFIQRKLAKEGVTLALAVKECRLKL